MNNFQFEKCKICGRDKKYVMFLVDNKQRLMCKNDCEKKAKDDKET